MSCGFLPTSNPYGTPNVDEGLPPEALTFGLLALGGPAALRFTGEVNSDAVDGRLKPDAPPAQLYDLRVDLPHTVNVYRENPGVVQDLANRLERIKSAGRTRP